MDKFKILVTVLTTTIFVSCNKKADINIIDSEEMQPVDYVLNANLSLKDYSYFEGEIYEEGLVSSPKIAFQIAEIIFNNIYGKEHIEKEKPFSINIENGIWIIEGSLYTRKGGVAYMEIRKSNGEILKVCHGK
jgi:hypothetical protein